jgi:phosphatidate cytidylyltransferase
MLSQRIITGPLLVLLLLGLAWLDQYVSGLQLQTSFLLGWPMGEFGIETVPPGLVLFVVCCGVIALAAQELAAVARASGLRCHAVLVSIFSILILASMWIGSAMPAESGGTGSAPMAMLACLLAACFFTALVSGSWGRRTDGVLASAATTVCFTIYLGMFLGFFMMIHISHSIWWIIGIIAIVKMCDTGAYFTGSAIGRHKMIPWLSPGKTWEGLAGGLVTSMLTGWGLAAMSAAWLTGEPVISTGWALALGLVIGLIGQLGDLTMSLLKRGADMKDSSTLLPGLGGIMDILDSPLLAAPVAWLLLAWITQTATNG